MQKPETYQIRNAVLGEILKVGPLTLSDLETRIGLPKSKIRYAIESTRPFEEVFWKYYVGRTCKYGAIL